MPELEFVFKMVYLFKVNCHRFDDYYHLVGSFKIPASIADTYINDALKEDWIHGQTPPLDDGDLIYTGDDDWGQVYVYKLDPGTDVPGMVRTYSWTMENTPNGLRESLRRIIGGAVLEETEEPISRRAQLLRERTSGDPVEEKEYEDVPNREDDDIPF